MHGHWGGRSAELCTTGLKHGAQPPHLHHSPSDLQRWAGQGHSEQKIKTIFTAVLWVTRCILERTQYSLRVHKCGIRIFIPQIAWNWRQTWPKWKPATLHKAQLKTTAMTQLSPAFTFHLILRSNLQQVGFMFPFVFMRNHHTSHSSSRHESPREKNSGLWIKSRFHCFMTDYMWEEIIKKTNNPFL